MTRVVYGLGQTAGWVGLNWVALGESGWVEVFQLSVGWIWSSVPKTGLPYNHENYINIKLTKIGSSLWHTDSSALDYTSIVCLD